MVETRIRSPGLVSGHAMDPLWILVQSFLRGAQLLSITCVLLLLLYKMSVFASVSPSVYDDQDCNNPFGFT